LRSDDARARAHAAWAIGHLRDHRARRSLRDLAHDPEPDVQRAVAHALATLGDSYEHDHRARTPVAAHGNAALRFRVATSHSDGIDVLVALADGRTLRWRTAPTGEVVWVDLAAQTADVRVIVAE
jgi:hypothetical protein